MYDGTPTWKFLTGWTTQNTLRWTPSAENPNYVMRVWVRNAANPKDEWEAEARMSFAIKAPVVAKVTSVTLATNKPAPQLKGTTIVTTATAVAGSATVHYKWLIHDGLAWKEMTGWTSSRTFSWTPTAANKGHYIGVWARNAASASGATEATMSIPFAIR